MDEHFLERLESIEDLPVLPPVLHRFNQIVSNPNSGVEDLVETIQQDAALHGNVLKVVNSNFYAASNADPIESIETAIIRLGFSNTRNVVFSTCLLRAFPTIRHDVLNINQFWLHSLAAGAVAQIVHEYCAHHLPRPVDASMLQLAALIHDLGKVLLQEYFLEDLKKVISHTGRFSTTFLSAELETLGTDHTRIGAWLVDRWFGESPLCDAVRWHHEPLQAHYDCRSMAAIVHAADYLCNRRHLGNSGNRVSPTMRNEVWEYLKIDEETMEAIIEHIQARNVLAQVSVSLKTSHAANRVEVG